MARAAVESPKVTRRSNRRGMRWVRSSCTCGFGERERHEDGLVRYLPREAWLVEVDAGVLILVIPRAKLKTVLPG